MSPHDTAYATLGLRPGASRAQVDEAYRRLIKLHHPDKSGGDLLRAAEINHAYTLLRRDRLAAGPHSFRAAAIIPRQVPARRRGGWVFTAVLLAIIMGGVAAMQAASAGRFGHPIRLSLPIEQKADEVSVAEPLISFDDPLYSTVIDAAIAQAFNFHQTRDSSGADMYSNDCQRRLRTERSLAWFDACAAFDEARLTLGSGDVAADPNAIGDDGIDAREMAAAHALSDDSLGADLRLHEIRSQVELQLVPLLDSAAAQNL